MSNLAKIILGAAILAGAAIAAATPALAQQQTQVQPFVPYNGSNGAGPLNPAAGQPAQNPNAPARFYGTPRFTPDTRNTNAACNRNSPYYDPNNCR